jgi:hypothetical protein
MAMTRAPDASNRNCDGERTNVIAIKEKEYE